MVIGPESTGKSTLSEGLAKHYNTLWVPEYARDYIDQLDRPYEEADLLAIAQGQIASEDALSLSAKGRLICDTDLNVVKVWSEHAFGRCHTWTMEQIAARRYDLYLLTYIDVPWQDDPQREHGELQMRMYFYNQYRDIAMNSGIPWADIRGSEQERLESAIAAIEHL